MENALGRHSILASGGPDVLANVTSEAAPAVAVPALTDGDRKKQVYYASDYGIFPNVTLNFSSYHGPNGDAVYYAGRDGQPNVKGTQSSDPAGWDLSAKINDFLQAIRASGGGIAVFNGDPAHPGNTQYGYGVGKPIELLGSVAIWGLGWSKTSFILLDNANCSVFVNRGGGNSSPDKERVFFDIRDLSINGNRWGQDFGAGLFNPGGGVPITDLRHPAHPWNWRQNSHGILLTPDINGSNTGNASTEPGTWGDTYARLENLYISNAYGSAVMTSRIGGEIRIRNVFSLQAGAHGFQIGYDTFVENCTAARPEYHGFYQAAGSTRYANCKAFFAGVVPDRYRAGGGSLPVRRASAGFYISNGTTEFASCEAQNCAADGVRLENADGVNGQFLTNANNTLADPVCNADLWGPVPDNFANDAIWGGGAKAAPWGEGDAAGLSLRGRSRWSSLVVVARAAGQQFGYSPQLGRQAYALHLDPAATADVSQNNIVITNFAGESTGTAAKGALTPSSASVRAIPRNSITYNGGPLSIPNPVAPKDIFTINTPGVYMAFGSGYTNHPWGNGSGNGVARITCTEYDRALFLEAVNLLAPGAPHHSVYWKNASGWTPWVQYSRA